MNKNKRAMSSSVIRRIYAEKTGVKIPAGYEVHHIDFNPNNNDISNLVAIPKDVHVRFHSILKEVGVVNGNVILPCNHFNHSFTDFYFNPVRIHSIIELSKYVNCICQFVEKRNMQIEAVRGINYSEFY